MRTSFYQPSKVDSVVIGGTFGMGSDARKLAKRLVENNIAARVSTTGGEFDAYIVLVPRDEEKAAYLVYDAQCGNLK